MINMKIGYYGGFWKSNAHEQIWFNGESFFLIDMLAMALLIARNYVGNVQTKPQYYGINNIFKLFLMI